MKLSSNADPKACADPELELGLRLTFASWAAPRFVLSLWLSARSLSESDRAAANVMEWAQAGDDAALGDRRGC